ncbi:MAG: ABC transporter substrate-binding protein [Chloroflexota bacterium]|nr:ABC transporter substrate-binding protein [Chloroflexota bacterium]
MKIHRISLMIALAATFWLTACGVATPPAAPRPPLTVSWTVWPGYYPLAIAQEQGLFGKHGIAVKIAVYDAYTTAYTEYASGKLDGSEMVLGDLLLLLNKRDSRAVMLTDSSEGGDQVVATNAIRTVADLKGKRSGVHLGTYGELFVRKMLAANGLTFADVTLVNINPEDVPAAFPDKIDAGHSFEPFTSEAAAKGGHVVFASTETPGLIPNVFAFSAQVAQQRPDDIRAFVAAWFEAVDWMNAHASQVPTVVAQVTGLKPEDIWMDGGDRVFTLTESRAAMTHGTDYRSLYFTGAEYVNFLTVTGSLTSAPDLEKVIDPTFLK